jgi:hypothetical protein
LLTAALLFGATRTEASEDSLLETNAATVAKLLAATDTWLLPQPKAVATNAEAFDLKKCKGIRLVGCDDPRLKTNFPALLQERCGLRLKASIGKPGRGYISLVLCPHELPPHGLQSLRPDDLAGLGDQGYCLRVDHSGITVGAATEQGLYYATRAIAQIANGRTRLPGMTIRDWPSLRYRGFQYDISRGQMPKLESLKRLAQVTAEAKMNMFEPYIEHVFQWQRYPDIPPPEALTRTEARGLFECGARYHMDVHPLMQVFGHFYNIGTKPPYRKFMVEDGGTVDIRKPDAVAFVTNLIDEVCDAFPGKFLNVDITEIDDAAFKKTGTTQAELNELTFQYALKIREAAARHGMRLMIAQAQLSAEGSLAGLGSVAERLPKDILISDYYTAEFYGGWEKDFPRLQKLGLDFFAQAWIDSHGHIMPYVGHAMDFSDIEISRGLQYGAVGSTTCDWGDDGHYHLPAVTWFPFVYHAASAWSGAKLDRDYFNQAFCRIFFGTSDDTIARAILLVGNINGQKLKLRNAAGGIDEPAYTGNSTFGRYYYEFFGDPFTDPKVLDIVEPGRVGLQILQPSLEAEKLLQQTQGQATRNRDVLERLLFTARNYEAMGRKLIVRDHYLGNNIPRAQVAAELLSLAQTYETLKADFQRLWLVDCQDAGSFRGYVQRFDNTIVPCRKKAEELVRKEKDVLVGVNYFPGWWKPLPNKWQDRRGEDWRLRFPERVPLLGEYNDQDTMNREIKAAAGAGVDFFSILWYYNPPGHERESNVALTESGLTNFMASPEAEHLRFIIEFVNHPPFEVATDADWDHCVQAWLKGLWHPSYLRVGGRLVFKVHGGDFFLQQNGRDPARARARLEALRQAVRQAGLGEMLIGGGVGAAERIGPGHPVAKVFDFTATYMDVPNLKQAAEDYPYETLAQVAREAWQIHATDALPYVPHLAAGWCPRPWADPRPCFKFPTRAEWEAELRDMKSGLASAANLGLPLPGGGRQPIFTIYAWNEFGEGGIVAPTHGEQTMKLDAIRAVFGP